MTTQQIIKLIHSKFHKALTAKTSWGRIELGIVFNNITIEVLAQAVDDIATESPCEGEDAPLQDKYDSIIFEHTQISEQDDQFVDNKEVTEFWNK